jgi:hypothetical protein
MKPFVLFCTFLIFYWIASMALAGGGESKPMPLIEGTCQPITGYDYKSWTVVEYSDLHSKAKDHALGRILMRREPTLVCKVSVKSRTICSTIGVTPTGPTTECITVEGSKEGEEVRYQWWWKRK